MCRCKRRESRAGHGSFRYTARTRCSRALAASTRAGVWPMEKARAVSMRSVPVPGGRRRVARICSPNCPIAISSESVCLVLEVDKKPPIEIAYKIARDCGSRSGSGHADSYADAQPCGHGAGRRPRAGGGVAQGACAWISPASRSGRCRCRATAAACRGFSDRHGAHQRCDSVWRQGAIVRRLRRRRRRAPRVELAVERFQRLRQAVCARVQGGGVRLSIASIRISLRPRSLR